MRSSAPLPHTTLTQAPRLHAGSTRMRLLSVLCATSPLTPISPYRILESGIGKTPVRGPVYIEANGICEDHIVDRVRHGGPDQAILLGSDEDYRWWESQLDCILPRGLFGDNLLLAGWSSAHACIGDRIRIGALLLEITGPRIPCANFARTMRPYAGPGWMRRFCRAGRPGAYARVLIPGVVAQGARVTTENRSGQSDERHPGPVAGPFGKPLPEYIMLHQALDAVFCTQPSEAFLHRLLRQPIGIRLRAMVQRQLERCARQTLLDIPRRRPDGPLPEGEDEAPVDGALLAPVANPHEERPMLAFGLQPPVRRT